MDLKTIEEFDRKQKANKLKHKRAKEGSEAKSKKSKLDHEDSVPSSSYRDRADERRQGINKDFEHDPDDLKILVGNSALDDDTDFIDEETRRLREIEDSKYLGGDVEHTHLVKGLDFALSQKIKFEEEEKRRLANEKPLEDGTLLGDDCSDNEEQEFRMEAIITAASERQIHKLDLNKLKIGQAVPCQTALARRIIDVMQEKFDTKSDLYLPDRRLYKFPLDDDCDDPTVTTIVRNRAELPNLPDIEEDNEKRILMDLMIKRLGRIREGDTATNTASRKNDPQKRRYEDLIEYYE